MGAVYYSLTKQGGRLADIKSFCCSASLMCPMTTPLVHLCAGSSPRPLLGEWRSCESEPCFPRTTIQNALDPSPFPWRAKHVHSEVRGGIPKWITKLWKALALEDCLTELLAPFPLPSTATVRFAHPQIKPWSSLCGRLQYKRSPRCKEWTHLSIYSTCCNNRRGKTDEWTSVRALVMVTFRAKMKTGWR